MAVDALQALALLFRQLGSSGPGLQFLQHRRFFVNGSDLEFLQERLDFHLIFAVVMMLNIHNHICVGGLEVFTQETHAEYTANRHMRRADRQAQLGSDNDRNRC